jgi:hypothetical protein
MRSLFIAALLLAATPSLAFRGGVGPRGGFAASGARGGAVARGPSGGVAVRSPSGAAAAAGPRGAAVRGPGGYTRGYYQGGRYWRAPGWGAAGFRTYGRAFVGYPGWRYAGTVGLAAGLAGFASLAFLASGMLIGTYTAQQETVYVYVVNDGDENVEYQVDSNGDIISQRNVPPSEDYQG